MKESHWRLKARGIILDVLQKTKGQSLDEQLKAIRAAYPFGERKMYPYKIWLSEVSRWTGKDVAKKSAKTEREQIEAGQERLF